MFRRNTKGLLCTSRTAKKIAQFSRNKTLKFGKITEDFNVADFCELLNNGIIKNCEISFAGSVSNDYKKKFKAAVENMKNKWNVFIHFDGTFHVERPLKFNF